MGTEVQMNDVTIGEVTISKGRDGVETGRSLVQCFDVGDFAVHLTDRSVRFWTCTHKPTGLSVAMYIETVFRAIECARECVAVAKEIGLDTTLSPYSTLKEHAAWPEFQKRGGKIRVKYNHPEHSWDQPAYDEDDEDSELERVC